MKSIKLESCIETHNVMGRKTDIPLNDKEIIMEVLNTPFKEGLKPQEMQSRFKIMDIVEKADKSLELDDAYFKELGDLIKDFHFGILSRHCLKLSEKFNVE